MSSYLTFYLEDKQSKEKKALTSYSRNSEMYQQFYEVLKPVYIGDGKEPKYTKLTQSDIQTVISEVQDETKKLEKRLVYEEKLALTDGDFINSVLMNKECIEENQALVAELAVYSQILADMEIGCSGFSGLYCNVD